MSDWRRWGPFLVAFGSLLWATDAVFRAQLVSQYSALALVFINHLLCVLVAFPYLFFHRKELKSLSLYDWFAALYLGVGSSSLAMIFFTKSFALSQNYTVPVLVQKLQPLIAISLAHIFLKETLNRSFWYLTFFAFVGVYLVSFGADWVVSALLGETSLPILYALLAATIWGAGTVFGRSLMTTHRPELVTSLRYVVATVFLAIWMWTSGSYGELSSFDLSDLFYVTLMAIIPGYVALFLYYQGMMHTKASVASLCELTFPVASILINWMFLGASLSSAQLIGAAILILSVTVLSLRQQEQS